MERRFQEYDDEGTGMVTPEDAVNILSAEFHDLPLDSIRCMIFRFDKDNNNMVDFSEFVDFYACIKAK